LNLAIAWLEEELEELDEGETLELDILEELVESETLELDILEELELFESKEGVPPPHPDKDKDAKPKTTRSLNCYAFIKNNLFPLLRTPPNHQKTALSQIREQTPQNASQLSFFITITYFPGSFQSKKTQFDGLGKINIRI
jgi:hypothetical protein